MISEAKSPLTTLSDLAAGDRKTQVMKNKVRTQRLRLKISGDYIITVAGTKVRNRGSILAAFGLCGVAENGDERVKADLRALYHIATAYNVGGENYARLDATDVAAPGTYQLEETFDLYFATPYQVNPGETSYVERDTRAVLETFFNVVANADALSDATATLDNITVETIQVADDKRASDPPLFVPMVREIIVPVAASNDALPIYLRSDRYLRGVNIMTETDHGEVADIISSLALLGDDDYIIGPRQAGWDHLVQAQYLDHPGMTTETPGQLFVPFMRHGKLSTILNPAHWRNLRIEAKVAESADGANSRIRVTLLELVRLDGVTAAQLPFVA